MKLFVKYSGALVRRSSIVHSLCRYITGKSFRIIYYHTVTDELPSYYFEDKGIRFDEFRTQIRNFKKYYSFISLSQAINKFENGESLKGYMCLTTDDGFIENYRVIAPFLIEEKIPATLFLIENCIDNKNLMWRNKLALIQNTCDKKLTDINMSELANKEGLDFPKDGESLLAWTKRTFPMNKKEFFTDWLWDKLKMPSIDDYLDEHKPYMNSAQIHELISQGFEIGSHSSTHPYCDKLDYPALEEEIIGSINRMEKYLGTRINFFSYPFGSRANSDLEKNLILKHGNKVKTLLGIKNILYNTEPYSWERDLQEADPDIATFRFFILPVLRKFHLFK